MLLLLLINKPRECARRCLSRRRRRCPRLPHMKILSLCFFSPLLLLLFSLLPFYAQFVDRAQQQEEDGAQRERR